MSNIHVFVATCRFSWPQLLQVFFARDESGGLQPAKPLSLQTFRHRRSSAMLPYVRKLRSKVMLVERMGFQTLEGQHVPQMRIAGVISVLWNTVGIRTYIEFPRIWQLSTLWGTFVWHLYVSSSFLSQSFCRIKSSQLKRFSASAPPSSKKIHQPQFRNALRGSHQTSDSKVFAIKWAIMVRTTWWCSQSPNCHCYSSL